ncbi:hypothetical protein KW791_01370 [Candidatus Parcubacteria bacterium]|nr:hypothetical protein [Candidatus Parcubacteria bacterium]
MNEFTAKKLGEVLAFANVGKEIFEKGRMALEEVFTRDGVNNTLHQISKHGVEIENLAKELGTSEITMPKSQKTGDKLRKMMELYVGEEWDNPAELLEWLGFFEGAAIVHWKLVEGAAQALDHTELKALTETGVSFHQELLNKVSQLIKDLGGKKAMA